MGVDRQCGWLSGAGEEEQKCPPCTPLGVCTLNFQTGFRTCAKVGAECLSQMLTQASTPRSLMQPVSKLQEPQVRATSEVPGSLP